MSIIDFFSGISAVVRIKNSFKHYSRDSYRVFFLVISREIAKDFVRNSTSNSLKILSENPPKLTRDSTKNLIRDSSRSSFSMNLTRDFFWNSIKDYSKNFAWDSSRKSIRDFSRNFIKDSCRSFARDSFRHSTKESLAIASMIPPRILEGFSQELQPVLFQNSSKAFSRISTIEYIKNSTRSNSSNSTRDFQAITSETSSGT